jgi:hypothetical protein
MTTFDYALVTKLYRKHKANLTRAKNRKDWAKVIEVCDAALADFERHGYPDDWHRFKSGKYDAEYEQRRASW